MVFAKHVIVLNSKKNYVKIIVLLNPIYNVFKSMVYLPYEVIPINNNLVIRKMYFSHI